MRMLPTLIEEKQLLAMGFSKIAGVDEAGRGPLAGPVVGAAVVLPLEANKGWYHLPRDSKELTPGQRERLFDMIVDRSLARSVGLATNDEIDRMGIGEGSRLAMQRAVESLSLKPDFLLVDYFRVPSVSLPQKGIVKGDSRCLSISAASILAKVTRDRLMDLYDMEFPGYAFGKNKGYGTRDHLSALARLGPCPIHRRSFAPVGVGDVGEGLEIDEE